MLTSLVRKIVSFVKRDFLQEKNYFFLDPVKQWLISFAYVIMWYYIVKVTHANSVVSRVSYGGNYFVYVMVGFAFLEFTESVLDRTVYRLRREQTEGSLETMFLTETHPVTLLFLLGISPFFFSLTRIAIYLGMGLALSHTSISIGNWMAAIATLLLTLGSLSGLSVISAACIIAFKRSSLFNGLHYSFFALFSGALFPISLLPTWLQKISYFIPLTYSLEAIRLTLLEGAGFGLIWKDLVCLSGFTLIGLPIGLWAFQKAMQKARADGSLAFF